MYIKTEQNIYKLCFITKDMKKIIKKYGNSLVIIFNSEDSKIYNLKEGDIINLEISKQNLIKMKGGVNK